MVARIVQWTTGNVGRRSVRSIVAHPNLKLVGCYAWSPEKVGRDAGELCGIEPTGVMATNNISVLLSLRPDCVVYNPMWPDVDEVVQILESGANIVSTAAFINGVGLGADRQRIVDACEHGKSTIFGTGINPGVAQLLGVVSAGICERIDKITVTESFDSTLYDSPDTERPAGFGRPIDDPDLQNLTAEGTAVFGEAVAMVADALGVELEEVVCETEYAQTTEDLDLGSWKIAAGCVAGIAASWQGRVGDRTVIDLRVRWRKGETLDPDWKIEPGYLVEVTGLPCVRTALEISPPANFEAATLEDYLVLGMIMTAMPAINAIPAVLAAPPGIVTYADIPLPQPRGLVSP